MHFMLYISESKDMLFRTELLMRSIFYFYQKKDCIKFSIIINGDSSGPIEKPLILSKHWLELKNNFIEENADVFYSKYHWIVSSPARWFLQSKLETCVLIDADVVACKDLTFFFDLEKDYIYGVDAYHVPMGKKEWNMLGFFDKKDFKYYLNFGMLVIPSKQMRLIGDLLIDIQNDFMKKFKNYEYFMAQISLAFIIKNYNFPFKLLPNNFNYIDCLPDENLNDVVFLHYINNRKHFCNLNDSFYVSHNNYVKKISSLVKILFEDEFHKFNKLRIL